MKLRAWPRSVAKVVGSRAGALGTALVAIASTACSDPVPPAPRGNLIFSLSSCTSYSGGVGADRSATPAEKSIQLPATDGTRPGRRLEDGQEGATIRCTVDGGDTNRIDASISGVQTHPSASFIENIGIDVEDGWLQKTQDADGNVTGGSGEAMITVKTGGVSYTPSVPCTLSLNSPRPGNQFTVDAGRVYASFNCPNLQDPPVSNCRATGAFVLERCREE